jgi:GNAT superfamily N-acetyltransferase
MDDFQIELLSANSPALNEVERLLSDMYAYMGSSGLLLQLAPNGVQKLRRSIESSLGRTGVLAVARNGQSVVGFMHGMLRLTPDYLGGAMVGLINHTYVQEQFRGLRLGARLFVAVEAWLLGKGAVSLELQVLTGNDLAIEFWEARGFRRELLQMRKLPAGSKE